MEDLINEIAKNNFVKINHSTSISIISYSKEELKDIEDTYDSLIIKDIMETDSLYYGIFNYK